jgi:hypothetical protein
LETIAGDGVNALIAQINLPPLFTCRAKVLTKADGKAENAGLCLATGLNHNLFENPGFNKSTRSRGQRICFVSRLTQSVNPKLVPADDD